MSHLQNCPGANCVKLKLNPSGSRLSMSSWFKDEVVEVLVVVDDVVDEEMLFVGLVISSSEGKS